MVRTQRVSVRGTLRTRSPNPAFETSKALSISQAELEPGRTGRKPATKGTKGLYRYRMSLPSIHE